MNNLSNNIAFNLRNSFAVASELSNWFININITACLEGMNLYLFKPFDKMTDSLIISDRLINI